MAQTFDTDPRASCCHGFAAIAAEYLYRDVLGVKAIDPKTKTIRVAPSADLSLDWCEGEMPLPDGTTAFVRWQRKNGRLDVDAKMPEGWHVAR